MTTILAAVAVVLFAILIAVCVFGLFVYQQEKWNEKKDEIKALPGPYSNITVQSMHPSPFSYTYSDKFNTLAELSRKVNVLDSRIDDLDEQITEFNQFYTIDTDDDKSLVDLYKELSSDILGIRQEMERQHKLIMQLYSDRDEDVNKIADQINRHESMISDMKENKNEQA